MAPPIVALPPLVVTVTPAIGILVLTLVTVPSGSLTETWIGFLIVSPTKTILSGTVPTIGFSLVIMILTSISSVEPS
ncbi:TPA: hypothetical protein ACT2IF_001394 [Streptococcus suis]